MNEYWKVLLFQNETEYWCSERFDAKWKALEFIKHQKGKVRKMTAKLQHWKMQSEEEILNGSKSVQVEISG